MGIPEVDAVNEVAASTQDTAVTDTPADSASTAQTPATTQTATPDQSGDWRSAYEAQAQEFRQFQAGLVEQQRAYQQALQNMQDTMTRAFLPDEYAKRQQPQYLTRDQVANIVQSQVRDVQIGALVDRLEGELSSAKEKYPQVFEDIPHADLLIKQIWANEDSARSKKSAMAIAKELNDRLTESYTRRQAAFVTQKEATRKTNPIPAGTGKPAGRDNGARGFARLRAALAGGDN